MHADAPVTANSRQHTRAAIRFAALLFVAFCATSAHGAASFPCEKASNAAEKAICADPELSQLDEYLARYYRGAREVIKGAPDCLAADQRRWLTSVRNACKDGACLKNAYLERLAELDALQPGVTRLNNVALPARPALAWIVPAELDAVAKPRGTPRPLEARGTLVNDSQGDGYLIRDASGRTFIVALRILVDPTTEDRLTMLAAMPKPTYLARGYAATDEKGRTYFEPARCTFVYHVR